MGDSGGDSGMRLWNILFWLFCLFACLLDMGNREQVKGCEQN